MQDNRPLLAVSGHAGARIVSDCHCPKAAADNDDEWTNNPMSKTDVKSIKVIKRNDLTPLCCHCDKELTEVYSNTEGLGFVVGKDVMYFCPHCLKVLGFAQSRMI